MEDLNMALAIYGFFAPAPRKVECAGIAYECNLIRDRISLGQSPGRALNGENSLSKCSSTNSSSADLSSQENLDNFMDKDDEKYYKYISKLDPNNFKDQDHYRVLGLSSLRYKATMGQIKAAYRQKVLVYHPDKGKATRNGSRNEAIFACIQKAYEILGLDIDKRRSYDSVDPKFDDSMPDASDLNSDNFYELLGAVFERHSRFSINQPVPQLGDSKSLREDVEHFYNFWFDFKSWREYSYMDEEDKSKGEDRWERREIEKMNRVGREQLRKKYLKKLSSITETAYEKDPRIAKFRLEDKQRKQDQKDRKRQEKQRLVEEREAEERKQQAELEAERQKAVEEEKQKAEEKQKLKKELQTCRKRLRGLIQQKEYFTDDPDKHLQVMEKLERLCMNASADELKTVADNLENVTELSVALELLSFKEEDSTQPKKSTNSIGSEPKNVVWQQDEILLLIKAANTYPPGSVERWTQVTKYVNEHSQSGSTKPKTEKDIIKEIRRMKSAEAASILQSTNTYVSSKPANSVNETQPSNAEESWSSSQQKQLESALKSTDSKDPERWDKIAKAVDGKTKKQCIQRYKDLVQMLKQNKAGK